MRLLHEYEWAQEKVSETTGYTREEREKAACRRRVKQMESQRAKRVARELKCQSQADKHFQGVTK